MILGRFADEAAASEKAGYHDGEVAHRPSPRWPQFPYLVFKGNLDPHDEWMLRVLEGEPIVKPPATIVRNPKNKPRKPRPRKSKVYEHRNTPLPGKGFNPYENRVRAGD